ncbi:MAG TPA: multidrug efflux RND transporter permease subunit [Candidatus Acidoferrum sp.]|nr:multidrug efflux RND transporter permease subunit [Candidatus Acidoferrum sp.]
MKFSHFFIRRPIFAAVLSIFILLLGAIALFKLPIAQYPEITPPTIFVLANYPGASAKTVADTVATPLEQEINGVENMLYMSAQCSSDGQLRLAVTFKVGTDPNVAQVLVQNRVGVAEAKLPDDVRRLGVTVRKRSPTIAMIVSLVSPSGKYDPVYLSNYAYLRVRDVLGRLPGVGDTIIFGARDYAMRIWVNPDKASARGLTAGDIADAIRRQNVEVAAGTFGQSPQPPDNLFQLTAQTRGRLVTPEEFGDIILKADVNGQLTRLRDVARVELAGGDYSINSLLDGRPAAAVAVFQQPGSNAIETADAIGRTMAELKKQFPEGLDYRIAFDTSAFIRESIHEVIKTLIEAMLLVVFVVILFLQNWRASLIPLLAVPVSLIGTFAVMSAMGFSLNNLTLFGLVLAIGIVVDDAIVVVENVERHIGEGLSPVEAARKAMDEVSGAVVAIALVLSAVFIPTAFIAGITGKFYQQFALTVAVSTLISAFNSLTLSPALSALLLRPHHEEKDFLGQLMHYSVGWLFRGFNHVFDSGRRGYAAALRKVVLRHCGISLFIYAGLLGLTWLGFHNVPGGFIPPQDKGSMFCYMQLPDGASLQRTAAVSKRVAELIRENPGIAAVTEIQGLSLVSLGNTANASTLFIRLAPFDERGKHGLTANTIMSQLRDKIALANIQEAYIGVFGAPPVDGLGTLGGFKLQVEDRSGAGFNVLQEATTKLAAAAMRDPRVALALTTFRANVPQVNLDVDRAKAGAMRVPLNNVWETLQVYLGSLYVNDFTYLGRPYHVTLQADAPFRAKPDDVKNLKTRNADGQMVPLGTLAAVRDITAPTLVGHYNMYPTAEITGSTAPGASTGEVIQLLNELAGKVLPPGMGIEWTELNLLQIQAGNTALYILPLCVLMVFLVLAAQYESWSLPLAIILVVPMSLLFAILGVWARGLDNNLFTQIGLVVLIGLACKNAILIVEFARQLQQAGQSRLDAVIEASRLRLRPILMTSFAFTFGVLPLMLSHGAGAEMRVAIGTAVFFGMLGVTFFGIFLTPVFYLVIRRVLERKKPAGGQASTGAATAGAAAGLLLLGLASVLCVNGCAAGPDYKPPRTQVSETFANAGQTNLSVAATETNWWRSFDDPLLNRLVGGAVAANHDLRIATARVREARALRMANVLDLFPTITATSGYTKSLSSQDSIAFPLPRSQRELQLYDAGFDATWEVDLFGRVRRSVQASTAEVAALESSRRDIFVTLISEIARNYFELRGAQMALDVARRNVTNQTETLDITLTKLRAGRGTDLDAARAQAQLQATLAIIPPLESAIQRTIYRLSVLSGLPPTALEAELSEPAQLPALPALVNIGKPEDLLRRRPDIRAAERSLAAATARIGVATADLFPRVTFNGNLGVSANEVSRLFKAGADTYSFGPRISWAALDLGRVRARIKAADARTEAELASYEKTVLTALEETEGALVEFSRVQVRRDYLAASAKSAADAVALATQRYHSGIDDFLVVLDAQRTLLSIQEQLAQSETRTATALVAVYKALGGGWESAPLASASDPPGNLRKSGQKN